MGPQILAWLGDPANWTGSGGALAQIGHHLTYTGVAFAIALALALPAGIYIGHTGKGEVYVLGAANAVRALPTLGLLILLVLVAAPVIKSDLAFTGPAVLVLVALAVPPLISGIATGFQAVPRSTIDAARGMGCTEWEIVWQIELPCAVPLIFSGIRSAVLQIVATAAVAAYVSLDGLGRFILDGRATNDYPEIAAGALLITALALALDLGLAGVQRLATSAGLRHAR